jgi:hypothetical protein
VAQATAEDITAFNAKGARDAKETQMPDMKRVFQAKTLKAPRLRTLASFAPLALKDFRFLP